MVSEHPRAGGVLVAVSAWRGDLKRFSTRVWVAESDVAAVMTVKDDEGACWVNLRHVPPSMHRLVLMWAWHAAALRPPFDVLYACDLPARLGDDRELAAEAE